LSARFPWCWCLPSPPARRAALTRLWWWTPGRQTVGTRYVSRSAAIMSRVSTSSSWPANSMASSTGLGMGARRCASWPGSARVVTIASPSTPTSGAIGAATGRAGGPGPDRAPRPPAWEMGTSRAGPGAAAATVRPTPLHRRRPSTRSVDTRRRRGVTDRDLLIQALIPRPNGPVTREGRTEREGTKRHPRSPARHRPRRRVHRRWPRRRSWPRPRRARARAVTRGVATRRRSEAPPATRGRRRGPGARLTPVPLHQLVPTRFPPRLGLPRGACPPRGWER
jgi:hypothetical protein